MLFDDITGGDEDRSELSSTSDGYCAEGDRGEYQISLRDREWTIALIEGECRHRTAIAPSTVVPSQP